MVGVRADKCTDLTPALDELWALARPRQLTEQVAADPVETFLEVAG